MSDPVWPDAALAKPYFLRGDQSASGFDAKIVDPLNALRMKLLTSTPVSGQATIQPDAVNTTKDLAITFDSPLPFTPEAVQITVKTGHSSSVTSNLWVSNVTANGFTVSINQSNLTAVGFYWTANP